MYLLNHVMQSVLRIRTKAYSSNPNATIVFTMNISGLIDYYPSSFELPGVLPVTSADVTDASTKIIIT